MVFNSDSLRSVLLLKVRFSFELRGSLLYPNSLTVQRSHVGANCGLKLYPILRQGRARSVIFDLYISGSRKVRFIILKYYGADPDIFALAGVSNLRTKSMGQLFKRSLAIV